MAIKLQIPHDAIGMIRNGLLPDDVTRRDALELLFQARNEHLNVREFTAFLRLADRIYAVSYPRGPRFYCRRIDQQLQIDSLHTSSPLNLTFLQELNNLVTSHPLVLVWLVGLALLKGSEVFKNLSEGLLNLKKTFSVGAEPANVLRSQTDAQIPAAPNVHEISDHGLARVPDDSLAQIGEFLDEALKNENL